MDRRRLAAPVLLALALVACSSDQGEDATPSTTGAETTDAETATTDPDAPEPEVFEGALEDFYAVPEPLPAGEPGDLIRTQVISETEDGTTLRVMYHSEDAAGTDRAVTGVITYPSADAPAPTDGWPVISTAHGTTGIASQCALSRRDEPAPGWGVDGVWAMSDYVGQGPVGELHPYLSKPSEGNAVIDIVRAARQLPDAHAGERWVSIGHSQGGHGALSAHELAPGRPPARGR